MTAKNKKVFVAMSGGVDSSVAAALLKESGYDVVGVTMCFNISFPHNKKPSCCGVEGINDAKRVAQILDIPHYVLNFAADIKDFIIDNFVQEYLNGRTPNPCVRCNHLIKFGILWEKVKALGADFLATGHYAKMTHDKKGHYFIKKARDLTKDQSYFLYGIKKEVLPYILFPLGDIMKTKVRQIARKLQLNTASKPESQDICFVSSTGYKDFIKNFVGEEKFVGGWFKNHLGEVVGQHKGVANYTIGQRDKLGLALGKPVYVYKIDKPSNTVYVGPQECLMSSGLLASEFNTFSNELPKKKMKVLARIRYNAREVVGYLTCLGGDRIKVEFKQPQKSVTPGQSVVFYKNNILLGGAVIDKAFK